ncbi:MAG TPA: tripartite tricarboxylate transporter substrate-binding protein [Acetobacteraceae bacterium]|nr:tripartite tricarboxylate transporter substrate-binding protein [Acetobacteraceae bacterium]
MIARRPLLAATLAGPGLAAAQGAWSPARPVRFMVGFPPGGSADLLTRRLAEALTTALGQTVVVENRPGAGANIAMDALAKSAPDGLTIALGPVGPHAISPALMGGRLPYDAARDFTPIIHVWDQPNVIVGGLAVPGDMPGFLAWLRGRPEEPYASVGAGTSNHLTGALLSHRLGLRMQHVPYRGSAAALTAIMGGEIRLFVDNVTTTIPLAREGRVRAIAVTTARRSASLPEVPTLAESGLPDLVISSWQGVFAPAGLPEPILARYNREIGRLLAEPSMIEWMRGIGAEPAGGTPQSFAAFLATERERWARIVRETGVTIE